ncbi:MAG: hypothetical protein JNM02_07565 [Anaerolineales bacterium]|nr:hypothetical protein [Anaerolineales bacterium]
MKVKNFNFLSMLMVISMLLAACGAGEATNAVPGSESEPAAGDVVPSPASSSNLVLDPANAGDSEAIAYLYEGLVRLQDGTVAPALAESYTVSEDGLDYIFNLRPGVTFHDGTTLNADIVIANFNRWFDPKDPNRGTGEFSAWAGNFGGFKGEVTDEGKAKSIYDGIEKVNDLTVLVHLNTTDTDFLTKLASPAFSIVNPNSFNDGDGGTGAYKFTSLKDSTATLEPFAEYWDTSAIPSESIEVTIK